jgi:Mn2+/Fe2+ NRAMP family transporter
MLQGETEPDSVPRSSTFRTLLLTAAVVGPGLMVMLADTDAGSVITAAQSGAEWGYRIVLPELVLIPILYLVQEITVRLGLVTGRGHGELIRGQFGLGWAILSVSTLFLSSIGALVTEFSGVAGTGLLLGLPPWLTVSAATVILVALGVSGSYRRVERIGIAIGLLELFFIPAALLAHPNPAALVRALGSLPLGNRSYVFLLAANVGAVIMPWMVFYQQGAVVDKGLGVQHLGKARLDTALGSILTQIIMIAVVVATAATIGRTDPGRPLNSVQEIAAALTPFIGSVGGRLVFGLGMLGASFVAALVVSIAGAWGVGEAFGFPHSLNDQVRQAPAFYLIYTLAHVAGALLVILNVGQLVNINIDVEVMNAVLLTVVLGFLLALEARVLPPPWRMRGAYRITVWAVSAVVMGFGLYMAVTLL